MVWFSEIICEQPVYYRCNEPIIYIQFSPLSEGNMAHIEVRYFNYTSFIPCFVTGSIAR